MSLQTKKLFERNTYEEEVVDDPFAREYGWSEVASGLSRVLLGYLLSFLCIVLAVVLALIAVFTVGKQLMAGELKRVDLGLLWLIIGGIGVISLLSLGSYILILTGKVRCAVHTPDRCGARWMIFLCILCLVVGPVLNIASSFIRPDQARLEELQAKMMEDDFVFDEHRDEIFSEVFGPTIGLSIFGTLVGLLASVFFVLYFRAIGVCFKENRLQELAEYYLIYSGTLLGVTIWLIWSLFTGSFHPLMALGVGVGWLANLVWYVFLVFLTRCVILGYTKDYKRSALA